MSRTIAFVLLVLFTLPLFTPDLTNAATTDIVMNEIGAYENSDHEWIEIFNKGTAPVDMTGWKFFEDNTNHGLSAFRGDMIIDPGEYAVIADVAANTAADYPTFTGTLLDSSWSTLTESGETLALKDNTGAIVEQFTYIAAPHHSLERIDATHSDYSEANWKEHTTGNTIGVINSVSTPTNTPPPNNSTATQQTPGETTGNTSSTNSTPQQNTTPSDNSTSSRPHFYERGDLLINEFVADAGDDDTEWIELYNPGDTDISLTGWTIEDGSKTKTNLSGIVGTTGNNRFVVIEKPKGTLNNAGDLILLKDPNGITIDEVSYGNWDDGNTLNNAPTANDPYSVARIKDGIDSFNNSTDFRVTTTPTKGSSNSINDPINTTTTHKSTFIKDIIISELFPDPIGADSKSEFIELYNKGTSDIDLLGWEIINAAGRKYTIDNKKMKDTIIKSKNYFILDRSVTGLAMKNTGGDEITVYQPDGDKPNAVLSYKEKTEQGHSYAWFGNQGYVWTTTPTPGAENIKTSINLSPDPDIEMPSSGVILEELSFDASDTTDPEQDVLSYHWDFGDNQFGDAVQVSHHYSNPGKYKVTLSVKDGTNEKKMTKTIVITADTTSSDTSTTIIPTTESTQKVTASMSPIVINEIAPNPKGKDDNEFVEITNTSDQDIDISGWRMTYQTGKKSYIFPSGTILHPTMFLIITPHQKIQLRNSADTITLYSSHGDFMDVISYEDAPEGQSLSRTNEGDFIWSTIMTPGKENIALETIDSMSTLSGPQSLIPKKVSTKASKQRSSKQSSSSSSHAPIIQTTLAETRELPLNTEVNVQGVVSSTPGILGTHIFYLAGSGMQIYVSSNNIPKLVMGDHVQLTGVRSQSNNEARIKVGKTNTIRIIAHGQPPIAHQLSIADIGEDYEGSLVQIKGEVIKTQWPSIYIDDGSDEARVYIKTSTGIPHIKINKGDSLQATGIVSQTTSGYRILPRTINDLTVSSSSTNQTQTEEQSSSNKTTLTLSSTHQSLPLIQIGVVSLFGIVFLASSLYIQRKGKK